MKVFIGQQITGKTIYEIRQEREKITQKIKEKHKDENIEIIDNVFEGNVYSVDPVNIPLFDLGESLEYLATADLAIFINKENEENKELDDCKIEYECCELFNIPIEIIDMKGEIMKSE